MKWCYKENNIILSIQQKVKHIVNDFLNKITEKVNMDHLIIGLLTYGIECCGTMITNYTKRRDVGFGLIDSVVGSFDETKRKAVSDFIGEEFKEDRKAIEFINKK